MKNLYCFALIGLFFPLSAIAQSQIYSVPVVAINQYFEDSIHVLGRLDLDLPVDGTVFVQFDGEGSGSPNDRIIVAANITPDWDTNDGNVSFMSSVAGERHTFSHTRTFPVTAGQHSFYAVAHNYVDTEGTGIATVYGTLSVEYIPQTSDVKSVSSISGAYFEGLEPVAFDSVTIEAPGPGKVEVRLNGSVDVNQGDIIVMAITDTKNWNYTDPYGIALERNIPFYPYVTLSTTRVYDLPAAGNYTFYAMGQRGYEEEGNGLYYPYTNMHARYYPEEGENDLEGELVNKEDLFLNNNLRLLDSIELDIEKAGKVEVRFDGILQSPVGKSILLAANNNPGYELLQGNVILETIDEDIDRHPFVHTQVFDVEPGSNTFYIMTENQGGGSATVDIHGHFLVKYYPESVVSTDDHFAEMRYDVWPNPARDQISIQPENSNEPLEISVIDLQGRIVQHVKNILPGQELKISSLLPGTYVLRVSNGNEVGYSKLVKE